MQARWEEHITSVKTSESFRSALREEVVERRRHSVDRVLQEPQFAPNRAGPTSARWVVDEDGRAESTGPWRSRCARSYTL